MHGCSSQHPIVQQMQAVGQGTRPLSCPSVASAKVCVTSYHPSSTQSVTIQVGHIQFTAYSTQRMSSGKHRNSETGFRSSTEFRPKSAMSVSSREPLPNMPRNAQAAGVGLTFLCVCLPLNGPRFSRHLLTWVLLKTEAGEAGSVFI